MYVYHNLRVLDNIEQYDYVEQYYEWDRAPKTTCTIDHCRKPKGRGWRPKRSSIGEHHLDEP